MAARGKAGEANNNEAPPESAKTLFLEMAASSKAQTLVIIKLSEFISCNESRSSTAVGANNNEALPESAKVLLPEMAVNGEARGDDNNKGRLIVANGKAGGANNNEAPPNQLMIYCLK